MRLEMMMRSLLSRGKDRMDRSLIWTKLDINYCLEGSNYKKLWNIEFLEFSVRMSYSVFY